MKKLADKFSFETIHYGILIMAGLGMAGSLFFSEVMNLPPCVLCWYQRIALYPIVLLVIVGIFRKDTKLYMYLMPLAHVGLFISIYHNLLYWKILPESIAPCTLGISCTTKFFEWFGFVTIPFMALLAFIIINTLIFMSYKKSTYEKS